MYIIEFLIKHLRQKDIKHAVPAQTSSMPEKCEHIFIPIDSTGEILACSKCGELIKKGELKIKPKNPFV